VLFFFFQAEDGIRDFHVTGVQTCALPIYQLYQEIRPSSAAIGNEDYPVNPNPTITIHNPNQPNGNANDYLYDTQDVEEVEESLSLLDKESDLIKKALKKHKGKRKAAAQELGISERTLYRKIKDLNLD